MYGKLESLQGTIVKAFLGLNLKSMYISLVNRAFLVNYPVRSMCSFFVPKYLLTGKYSKSTLFDRLLDMGLPSLSLCTFNI